MRVYIYDLTFSDYGKSLIIAFDELKKYRQIEIYPSPEERNFQFRQQAMDLVQRYYNPYREQVHAGKVLDHFTTRVDPTKKDHIFLLDQDIHTDTTNWVFGFFQQRGPLRYLISSSARITSDAHAIDHLTHELGHMYGAPSDGRISTTMHLGLHCISPLCVMQQRDTVAGARKYVEERQRAQAAAFCKLCQADLIMQAMREKVSII